MAQRVHLLTLIVTSTGAIPRMKMEETDGATTEFTFTSLEENIPLPASDFIFTPPPGIPIVSAQPPISVALQCKMGNRFQFSRASRRAEEQPLK